MPVFIVLLWLLPGAEVASAQTKVSIANLIVSSSHLPLWIAHEQGLFARQGIDAEILIVDGVGASRQIAGDIPFGVIGIPAAMTFGCETGGVLPIFVCSSTGQPLPGEPQG